MPRRRRAGVVSKQKPNTTPRPNDSIVSSGPPMSCTTLVIPTLPDQFVTWPRHSVECGWWKTRIQPTAIAVGTKASRKTVGENVGLPHFVQPPISCESAMMSPAPARIP